MIKNLKKLGKNLKKYLNSFVFFENLCYIIIDFKLKGDYYGKRTKKA